MRSIYLETSLRRFMEENLALPEKHRDRIFVHWAGEQFKDNQLAWIVPRITQIQRLGPRDGDRTVVVLRVTIYEKVEPKGERFGFLSLLGDEVRLVVDPQLKQWDLTYNEDTQQLRSVAAENARGAAKVYNREGQVIGVLDFSAAQETRSYDTQATISGVTLSGVNSLVLTVQVQVTPVLPRVLPRT